MWHLFAEQCSWKKTKNKMQSTWTQLFLHSIISIFSIMTTDLCWKRDGTAKRNSFFCLGSDWENAASCDVKIAVINNEIRMLETGNPKWSLFLSSAYFIMHAFTSPLSHSLSPLTNFLCLSSPPCHLPLPSPPPPPPCSISALSVCGSRFSVSHWSRWQ